MEETLHTLGFWGSREYSFWLCTYFREGSHTGLVRLHPWAGESCHFWSPFGSSSPSISPSRDGGVFKDTEIGLSRGAFSVFCFSALLCGHRGHWRWSPTGSTVVPGENNKVAYLLIFMFVYIEYFKWFFKSCFLKFWFCMQFKICQMVGRCYHLFTYIIYSWDAYISIFIYNRNAIIYL